jgi:hypothetical protein
MPCYNTPIVKIIYPPGCDPTPVPVISSDQVRYDGPNLSCTGVQTGDCLNTVLEKIDEKICSEELVASIIQTIANNDVLKAYFCQLVSSCSPTTTTTSTSSTTTTTSTSTTTTTTTIAPLCETPVITSIVSNGGTSVTLNWSSASTYIFIDIYKSFDDGVTYDYSSTINYPLGSNGAAVPQSQGAGTTVYYKIMGGCTEESFSEFSEPEAHTN